VIASFRDRETERIYRGQYSRSFPADFQGRALNKLRVLIAIVRIEELLAPPSNRLEALKGDRAGQYSIRINDRWRLCFTWADGAAHEVEIIDYH